MGDKKTTLINLHSAKDKQNIRRLVAEYALLSYFDEISEEELAKIDKKLSSEEVDTPEELVQKLRKLEPEFEDKYQGYMGELID